jgi:hypothetical protein
MNGANSTRENTSELQARKGVRAAAGSVSKPKTTFFGVAIFMPNRQVRHDITPGRDEF